MKAIQIRSGRTVARYSGKMTLLALAMMSSQFTLAAEDGWYMGGNVGQARARIDDQNIIARMLEDGFSSVSIADDESDVGYKLFAGYQINRHFAIEGGYFSLGRFEYQATMMPTATMDADIKFEGANIDLVGILPLGESLSAFGRFGLNYAETRGRFSSTGDATLTRYRIENEEVNEKYGLGLQYDFSESFSMRVEAERYRVNDWVGGNRGDVDMYSLGVLYRFGSQSTASAASPPPAEPAPVVTREPRQSEPEPQPVAERTPRQAEPEPQPAPLMQVNLSADSLFTFDDASLASSEHRELNGLIRDLNGLDYETIIVTGHTDRIGSSVYNQGLSQRRADAVKSYLLASSNIAENRIVARGASSSRPLTTSAQCPTRLSRTELMTCLQADRRVEVEVTGTREQ